MRIKRISRMLVWASGRLLAGIIVLALGLSACSAGKTSSPSPQGESRSGAAAKQTRPLTPDQRREPGERPLLPERPPKRTTPPDFNDPANRQRATQEDYWLIADHDIFNGGVPVNRATVPGTMHLTAAEWRGLILTLARTLTLPGGGEYGLGFNPEIGAYGAIGLYRGGPTSIWLPEGWTSLAHTHPYGHSWAAEVSPGDILSLRYGPFSHAYVIEHASADPRQPIRIWEYDRQGNSREVLPSEVLAPQYIPGYNRLAARLPVLRQAELEVGLAGTILARDGARLTHGNRWAIRYLLSLTRRTDLGLAFPGTALTRKINTIRTRLARGLPLSPDDIRALRTYAEAARADVSGQLAAITTNIRVYGPATLAETEDANAYLRWLVNATRLPGYLQNAVDQDNYVRGELHSGNRAYAARELYYHRLLSSGIYDAVRRALGDMPATTERARLLNATDNKRDFLGLLTRAREQFASVTPAEWRLLDSAISLIQRQQDMLTAIDNGGPLPAGSAGPQQRWAEALCNCYPAGTLVAGTQGSMPTTPGGPGPGKPGVPDGPLRNMPEAQAETVNMGTSSGGPTQGAYRVYALFDQANTETVTQPDGTREFRAIGPGPAFLKWGITNSAELRGRYMGGHLDDTVGEYRDSSGRLVNAEIRQQNTRVAMVFVADGLTERQAKALERALRSAFGGPANAEQDYRDMQLDSRTGEQGVDHQIVSAAKAAGYYESPEGFVSWASASDAVNERGIAWVLWKLTGRQGEWAGIERNVMKQWLLMVRPRAPGIPGGRQVVRLVRRGRQVLREPLPSYFTDNELRRMLTTEELRQMGIDPSGTADAAAGTGTIQPAEAAGIAPSQLSQVIIGRLEYLMGFDPATRAEVTTYLTNTLRTVLADPELNSPDQRGRFSDARVTAILDRVDAARRNDVRNAISTALQHLPNVSISPRAADDLARTVAGNATFLTGTPVQVAARTARLIAAGIRPEWLSSRPQSTIPVLDGVQIIMHANDLSQPVRVAESADLALWELRGSLVATLTAGEPGRAADVIAELRDALQQVIGHDPRIWPTGSRFSTAVEKRVVKAVLAVRSAQIEGLLRAELQARIDVRILPNVTTLTRIAERLAIAVSEYPGTAQALADRLAELTASAIARDAGLAGTRRFEDLSSLVLPQLAGPSRAPGVSGRDASGQVVEQATLPGIAPPETPGPPRPRPRGRRGTARAPDATQPTLPFEPNPDQPRGQGSGGAGSGPSNSAGGRQGNVSLEATRRAQLLQQLRSHGLGWAASPVPDKLDQLTTGQLERLLKLVQERRQIEEQLAEESRQERERPGKVDPQRIEELQRQRDDLQRQIEELIRTATQPPLPPPRPAGSVTQQPDRGKLPAPGRVSRPPNEFTRPYVPARTTPVRTVPRLPAQFPVIAPAAPGKHTGPIRVPVPKHPDMFPATPRLPATPLKPGTYMPVIPKVVPPSRPAQFPQIPSRKPLTVPSPFVPQAVILPDGEHVVLPPVPAAVPADSGATLPSGTSIRGWLVQLDPMAFEKAALAAGVPVATTADGTVTSTPAEVTLEAEANPEVMARLAQYRASLPAASSGTAPTVTRAADESFADALAADPEIAAYLQSLKADPAADSSQPTTIDVVRSFASARGGIAATSTPPSEPRITDRGCPTAASTNAICPAGNGPGITDRRCPTTASTNTICPAGNGPGITDRGCPTAASTNAICPAGNGPGITDRGCPTAASTNATCPAGNGPGITDRRCPSTNTNATCPTGNGPGVLVNANPRSRVVVVTGPVLRTWLDQLGIRDRTGLNAVALTAGIPYNTVQDYTTANVATQIVKRAAANPQLVPAIQTQLQPLLNFIPAASVYAQVSQSTPQGTFKVPGTVLPQIGGGQPGIMSFMIGGAPNISLGGGSSPFGGSPGGGGKNRCADASLPNCDFAVPINLSFITAAANSYASGQQNTTTTIDPKTLNKTTCDSAGRCVTTDLTGAVLQTCTTSSSGSWSCSEGQTQCQGSDLIYDCTQRVNGSVVTSHYTPFGTTTTQTAADGTVTVCTHAPNEDMGCQSTLPDHTVQNCTVYIVGQHCASSNNNTVCDIGADGRQVCTADINGQHQVCQASQGSSNWDYCLVTDQNGQQWVCNGPQLSCGPNTSGVTIPPVQHVTAQDIRNTVGNLLPGNPTTVASTKTNSAATAADSTGSNVNLGGGVSCPDGTHCVNANGQAVMNGGTGASSTSTPSCDTGPGGCMGDNTVAPPQSGSTVTVDQGQVGSSAANQTNDISNNTGAQPGTYCHSDGTCGWTSPDTSNSSSSSSSSSSQSTSVAQAQADVNQASSQLQNDQTVQANDQNSASSIINSNNGNMNPQDQSDVINQANQNTTIDNQAVQTDQQNLQQAQQNLQSAQAQQQSAQSTDSTIANAVDSGAINNGP